MEPQTPLIPLAVKLAQGLKSGKHRINFSRQSEHVLPYFAGLARSFLGREGFTFASEQISERKLSSEDRRLLVFLNPNTLAEILPGMLLYSNNFTTNQLLLAAGAARSGYPATLEKGLAVLRHHLHEELDLVTFCRKSETEMIDELRRRAGDGPCRELLEGVFGTNRQLYKRVAEFSLSDAPELYQRLARKPYHWLVSLGEELAEEVADMLGESVGTTELLVDAPPTHREVEFDVEIYSAKNHSYQSLRDASPVIDALARTQFDDYVKRVRIFAHPRLAQSLAQTNDFHQCLERALNRIETDDSVSMP